MNTQRETSRTEETLIAATISLMAEGVAVLLFFMAVLTWVAIIGTAP